MPVYEASESDFELIPEGEIVSAKVKEIKAEILEFGPRLNWAFEVTETPWEGVRILDSSSQKFTIDPPSKFYEWSCQLLGRTFEVGDPIDTEDLIGLPCRVEIAHKPAKDDPSRVWLRVGSLIAPRGQTKTAEEVFG
jgi:hypothetical protein